MLDPTKLNDGNRITYFGLTDYRGNQNKFGIRADDRTRHTYVIGKTGMGKSTLLENMAIQDIINGEGLCFIDPHGTTAEKLLKYVPEERIGDVVYFAPFDTKYPVALNILEHVSEDERHLVASGLMDTFKKIFEDQFSGRMIYLLNNAILSLLENEGESLMGINRIYADKEYRKKIISNVKDPAVLSFWRDEYAKYDDKYVKEASAAIQNKIGQFIMTPLIRNIVGQKKTSFDMRKIMDERKILICNFSIGQTGADNVDLIGSLLITKIYLAALSRANLNEEQLKKAPPFYFYVDEFQNFVNDSFAQILSQARKYNLGLVIAHQYIEQLSDNVKAAVFGNVGTMISFRVGATDAELLEKEFAPQFTADDIVNLGPRQIYLRLSIEGVGSKPFSARTMPPLELENPSHASAIVATSRAIYGKEKKVAEEEISIWYEPYIDTSKSNQDYAKDRIEKDRVFEARKPLNTVGAAIGSYSHSSNTNSNRNYKPNNLTSAANRNTNAFNSNSSTNSGNNTNANSIPNLNPKTKNSNHLTKTQAPIQFNDKKDEEPIFKPKTNNFALRDALQSAMNVNLGDVGSVAKNENANTKSNVIAEDSKNVFSSIQTKTKGAPNELLEKIMNLEEE